MHYKNQILYCNNNNNNNNNIMHRNQVHTMPLFLYCNGIVSKCLHNSKTDTDTTEHLLLI
jgi:hypothetical protein